MWIEVIVCYISVVFLRHSVFHPHFFSSMQPVSSWLMSTVYKQIISTTPVMIQTRLASCDDNKKNTANKEVKSKNTTHDRHDYILIHLQTDSQPNRNCDIAIRFGMGARQIRLVREICQFYFLTLIGCNGNVPWEIKKKSSKRWRSRSSSTRLPILEFCEDWFISFWETGVRKLTINKKYIYKIKKKICKIYSPSSKFAKRVKLHWKLRKLVQEFLKSGHSNAWFCLRKTELLNLSLGDDT